MSLLEWLGFAPSLPSFVARLKRVLERATGEAWHWDPDRRVLRTDSGQELAVANSYLEYRQARRPERAGLLGKYVELATRREIPKLWTLAAQGIYPTVRSRHDFMVHRIELRARGSDATMPSVARPITADLEMRLVWDAGRTITLVTPELVETWGQSADAVWAEALQNLRALPASKWVDCGLPGVLALASEAGYQESLLLVDRVVDALPFAAHAVVAAPNRGVLFAADGRDPDAIRSLLELVEKAHDEHPWPLCVTPLVRGADGWRVFETGDRELAFELQRLARIDRAQLYADQKQALERMHEAAGTDVFVATYSLFRRGADMPVESWCTWGEGVDSLLPESDVVAMGATDGSGVFVPTEVARELAGSLFEATEEDPPRWRVRGFPSADVWRLLRERGDPIERDRG